MKHALRLRDDARAGRLSLDGLGEAVEALAARLARRLTRPGPLADVQRFAAHLTREWTALFNFLRNPAIDATNWRAYFAEVEHRFPGIWNTDSGEVERSSERSDVARSVSSQSVSQPAHEMLSVTSCSKSTTILPVERMGGVLCRRQGGVENAPRRRCIQARAYRARFPYRRCDP